MINFTNKTDQPMTPALSLIKHNRTKMIFIWTVKISLTSMGKRSDIAARNRGGSWISGKEVQIYKVCVCVCVWGGGGGGRFLYLT